MVCFIVLRVTILLAKLNSENTISCKTTMNVTCVLLCCLNSNYFIGQTDSLIRIAHTAVIKTC